MSTRSIASKLFPMILATAFLLYTSLILAMPPIGAGEVALPEAGWDIQSFPLAAYDLKDVDAVNADVAWAVGDNNIIAKTVNGGQTWVIQPFSGYPYLERVDAVDVDTAWVVGGQTLLTTQDGSTWQSCDTSIFNVSSLPFPYNLFSGTWNFSAVTAIDADTAWVAMLYRLYPPSPFPPNAVEATGIWKTIDGGANWSLQFLNLAPPYLHIIEALDAQKVWAVGSQVLKSTDGGATWTTQDTGATGSMQTFSAIDSNTAVGLSSTQIIKTFDGGGTWTVANSNLNDVSVVGGVAVDANVIWVVGKTFLSQQVILKSVDGGNTWASQYSQIPTLNDMAALDPTTAWVVGSNTVLKTTDGGMPGRISSPCHPIRAGREI